MTHRCYSETPIDGERVTLSGAEAHHLLHVLRAGPGAEVTLFDGSGAEFDAAVAACGRSTVELAVRQRRTADRELAVQLTLGVPLPKGDRQRWIVEKAVELGVARLVPLRTERSASTSEKAGEKLDRYVIEACKQCGRNRLMEIAAPQGWNDWLAAAAAGSACRVVADPTGRPLEGPGRAPTGPIFAAVGPEGGLTAGELSAAHAAMWDVVCLGPRILRIETAAVVLTTVLTR